MADERQDAKAQHYIPKFYLKGFAGRDGVLWVYERFKPPTSSTPKKEAHKPDYYAHVEEGQRDDSVEDELQTIESKAAPIVAKLANPQFKPSAKQMGDVYMFIAFMFARVPSWREHLDRLFVKVARDQHLAYARDKNKFHGLCVALEAEQGRPIGMDYEILRLEMLSDKYELQQTSIAYNLNSMFRSALRVAEELQHFSYEVLYAPSGAFFMTSDFPVVTLQPDGAGQATLGVGFGWPNVLVHFPLNKRTCLRMRRRNIEPAKLEMSEGQVADINRLTMVNANQFLYGASHYRKISRLFDQWGCRIKPGENAFMREARPPRKAS